MTNPLIKTPSTLSFEHTQGSLDAYLWASAGRGDTLSIEDALDLGANPNAFVGPQRTTALMRACAFGQPSSVEALVALSDVNALCPSGMTASGWAVEKNQAGCLLLLADFGADLNLYAPDSCSPLHGAYLKEAGRYSLQSNPHTLGSCLDLLLWRAHLHQQNHLGQTLEDLAQLHSHFEFLTLIRKIKSERDTTPPHLKLTETSLQPKKTKLGV